MNADVLLILAEFAEKLLREGAFNGMATPTCSCCCSIVLALMTVIAATLASPKKSREEALAEQENRAQYYTAIGWLCEYDLLFVALTNPYLPS